MATSTTSATKTSALAADAADTARALQTKLADAPLRIATDIDAFAKHRFDVDGNDGLGVSVGDGDALMEKDPASVQADVAAQIAFLRKQKFQYLEQNAKDKYIRAIVSDIDDAPVITSAINEALRADNEFKKERLRAKKAALADKHRDIRTLAPLVLQDYTKGKSLTSEAASLAQGILDARLAITRLRQAHPAPRLTEPAALATLDAQVAHMQTLDAQIARATADVAGVKEKVQDAARACERLRVERGVVEEEVRRAKGEREDGRVAELYDWYTSSLALHRSLLSLTSSHSASENELRLTYALSPPHAPDDREITLTLIFLPNTRQLAAANVDGLPPGTDVAELVDTHVQRNDVPGLVAAIVARGRAASGNA
ncbi:hypothetical protein PLICRDRAFT_50127 [Plicaturopsis crispa FD-325 SS-3]|nr:hypothetical protein PLICRDRAFT_50127 [Plicaturopsis crispa FD-325 SS-3]